MRVRPSRAALTPFSAAEVCDDQRSCAIAPTVGKIRASVATLGDRRWSIAADLRDDDPIPEHPLGGDLSRHPLDSEVEALTLSELVARPIGLPIGG